MGWRTSVTGNWPDKGMLDLGYHHRLPVQLRTGDVNGDGNLTWADVQQAFFLAFEDSPIDYNDICAADINFDQIITMNDVQLIAGRIF